MTELQGDTLILTNEAILAYVEQLTLQFEWLTQAFTILQFMIGTAFMLMWFLIIYQIMKGREK